MFRFDDVDQLGGRTHGPGDQRGLALVFDRLGVEVTGPGPGARLFVPWSEVTWSSIGEEGVGADGRAATTLELESGAGLVQYVVRSDEPMAVQMAGLDARVARWAGQGPPCPEPGETAGPSVVGPSPPSAVGPARTDVVGEGPTGPRRSRRTATLVVALALLASGIGLAIALSTAAPDTAATRAVAVPTAPSDVHMARLMMLTQADLPQGWRAAKDEGNVANSPSVQRGESQITRSLAGCMGITESQAAIVLGGQAPDQTAQTASPVFVAPSSSAAAGSALELQTAASVVHSHHDEQSDFSLFANPRYPQCAATASAAELQLGVDQTSGGHDQPGPATVSPVDLPGPSGLQESGLIMAFSVKDGSASLPVEVETISLGADRVEASLQVFAIGGQVPNDALSAAFSTFEQRVASGGKTSVV